jgi:hypothetical protein
VSDRLSEFPGFEYYMVEGQSLDDEMCEDRPLDAYALVAEFHHAFGMLVNDPKSAQQDGGLRERLIHEERKEFLSPRPSAWTSTELSVKSTARTCRSLATTASP